MSFHLRRVELVCDGCGHTFTRTGLPSDAICARCHEHGSVLTVPSRIASCSTALSGQSLDTVKRDPRRVEPTTDQRVVRPL